MSDVPSIIQRIMAGAHHTAGVLNYPFAQRSPMWEQRLMANRHELQWLDSFTDCAPTQYASAAAMLSDYGSQLVKPMPAGNSGARGSAALQALERAASQTHLNAFITLASADQLRQQQQQIYPASVGPELGHAMPLAGVPIAVKDLMDVQGFPLTAGSGGAIGAPRSTDAVAVQRLRQAGAIILGTTNLHELAYGITSANPHFGVVQNPAHADHIAGGSSGGSAAAVAAGIVDIAIGTDTAGSIRVPAACCGVVGFKPTYDAVPRAGALDLGPTLDHVGPLANSVANAALAFSAMTGQPDKRPVALANLSGVKVGIPANYFYDPLQPQVAQSLASALDRLQRDGAQLISVDIPGIENSPAIQLATLCPEATAVNWQRLVQAPETLGDDVRVRLEIGQFFPGIWYTRAQGARQRLADHMQRVCSGVDILVTPTLRTTAPLHNASQVTIGDRVFPLHAAVTSLTLPFNLVGMPAITLPCGRDQNNLPIGMQLAAWRNLDWRLLSIAGRCEYLLSS
jgi:aspartyl-tRNA(Asn)/glutamyl-tRNA(Gln) amidotransferase subunit A